MGGFDERRRISGEMQHLGHDHPRLNESFFAYGDATNRYTALVHPMRHLEVHKCHGWALLGCW